MAPQHQSRNRIIAILKAAGKPMSPKEIYDAQKDEPDAMTHAAIRKLLRDMLRWHLRQDLEGRYALFTCRAQTEINAARRSALQADLNAVIERHQAQRRTQIGDIVSVLHELLRRAEATLRNVPVETIQINVTTSNPHSEM
jgi:Fe2+ or Zn2+ uptake regulation protein